MLTSSAKTSCGTMNVHGRSLKQRWDMKLFLPGFRWCRKGLADSRTVVFHYFKATKVANYKPAPIGIAQGLIL